MVRPQNLQHDMPPYGSFYMLNCKAMNIHSNHIRGPSLSTLLPACHNHARTCLIASCLHPIPHGLKFLGCQLVKKVMLYIHSMYMTFVLGVADTVLI